MPKSPRFAFIVVFCWLTSILLGTVPVHAQPRIQIPPATAPPVVNPSAPIPPITGSPSLGQPAFDPYSTQVIIPPNAASVPPTLPRSPVVGVPGATTTIAPGTAPAITSPPPAGWPSWSAPPAGASPYTFPNTGYPPTYPQQPSVMFPNGLSPNWEQTWPINYAQQGRYLRLFQDVRLTHTWLAGGDGTDEMGVNETEIATTVNFPNFLWSNQPLGVSPGFVMDWWDGPVTSLTETPPFPTELPPRVYAAYLGFGWQPHLSPQVSADLDVSVGVYSDYEGFTSDSVRILGTGLIVMALTPTLTLKAGVTYLDRVDIKLLPAGGIMWTPDPRTRWDIYFPRPKVSRYLTTAGNTDIWIFFQAEYGGGSWTVRREGADDRRVDMNDIRVGGGLEWTCQAGLSAFVEAAYVFDRELVFASGAPQTAELQDTLMVRGGLIY